MKRGVLAGALIIVAVAAAVVIGVATAGPSACSLVGCSDGITVHFWKAAEPRDEPVFVRFCAVGKCDQARVAGGRIAVELPCPEFEDEGTVALTGRVIGSDGEVESTATKEIKIRRVEPNGAKCEPTCWVGHAGFSVRKAHFVPEQQAFDAISRRY